MLDYIWSTVKNEMHNFLGAMLFYSSAWDIPWHPCVMACDASVEGCGVAGSLWPAGVVQEVGQTRELFRYRFIDDSVHARTHALTHAGLVDYLSTQIGTESGFVECYVVGFAEVPAMWHFASGSSVVGQSIGISIVGARCLLLPIAHAYRQRGCGSVF